MNKSQELKIKIKNLDNLIKKTIKESPDFKMVKMLRKDKIALQSNLRVINWRKEKKVKSSLRKV